MESRSLCCSGVWSVVGDSEEGREHWRNQGVWLKQAREVDWGVEGGVCLVAEE